jgi:hypothetical protein
LISGRDPQFNVPWPPARVVALLALAAESLLYQLHRRCADPSRLHVRDKLAARL